MHFPLRCELWVRCHLQSTSSLAITSHRDDFLTDLVVHVRKLGCSNFALHKVLELLSKGLKFVYESDEAVRNMSQSDESLLTELRVTNGVILDDSIEWGQNVRKIPL